MTPNQTASAKRTRFSTPAQGVDRARRDENVERAQAWTRPSPLIVQRRAEVFERAIALEAVFRTAALLLVDCLILFLAYLTVDALRGAEGMGSALPRLVNEVFPRGVFPLGQVLSAVIVSLAILGNYRSGARWRNGSTLFAGSTLGLSLVFWNSLWTGVSGETILGFLVLLVGLGIVIATGRAALYKVVQSVHPRPMVVSRALIVGSRAGAERLKDSDALRSDRRLKIVGHITVDRQVDDASLGALSDLVWIIERHQIDTLVIADSLEDDALADVLEMAERSGCTTVAGSPIFPVGGFVPKVIMRGHSPYVAIARPSLRLPQLVSKKIFDIAAALVLLTLLAPLFATIAFAIRFSSRGPIFFKHLRVGYGGRHFHMYKFRSMVNNAEELRGGLKDRSIYADARLFKITDDPRVTRLGRFLRRASLDELPQLWNVLKGEMSMVGPRPPLATEVETYEEHHYSRFDMKPGITGPWQVSGRNSITNFDEIVALETNYLTEWSLLKDFIILLRTVPAVLSMRGAV